MGGGGGAGGGGGVGGGETAVLPQLYGRLNLNLVRAKATAILSRWIPSSSLSVSY